VLGRVARWIVEQLAFLAVLAVLAAAFGYLLAAPEQWRHGTIVIAAALLLAGVLRAALPTSWVGMLVVRHRALDAVAYLMLGGVILGVEIRLHN
jgi:Protein of unknown function (DUF3017)